MKNWMKKMIADRQREKSFKELFEKLSIEKGVFLVSSAALSVEEIEQARIDNRFYVNENGLGFAIVTHFHESWPIELESENKKLKEDTETLQNHLDELKGLVRKMMTTEVRRDEIDYILNRH